MRPAEYAAESTTTLKDNPRFGGLSSFALSRRMAKNDPRVVLITIVLSLGNLAICIHRSSRVYLFQQSRCLQHYLTFDPTVISPQWEVEESLCKIQEVQSSLSTTEGIDSVLQLLPALVALPTFQKLLPITGLRRLLLINLACVACGISLSIFFYSLHSPWTNVAILLTFICDVLGGGDLTRITLCVTTIADLLPPEQLTSANNYISSLFILASVGGSAIGSLLLSRHDYVLNFIGISCALLALGVATLLPSRLGCDHSRTEVSDESAEHRPLCASSSDIEGLERPPPYLQGSHKIQSILLSSWKSSLVAATTLFRVANPTFTVILIFFIYGFTARIEVLNIQYISLSLHWSLASANSLVAIKALVSACLLLALPTLRRKYLHSRMNDQQADLFIVQASLFLNCIGMTGYGFSLPAPLLTMAVCIYTSGNGVYDSLTTFGRSTLPADEKPAAFFVRTGLVATLAGLISAPFWTTLFRFCIKSSFWPIGLPMWIAAGLFGINLILARSLFTKAAYHAVPSN